MPSVIAGEATRLVATLTAARGEGHGLAGLRTLLVVGDPLATSVRRELQSVSNGAAVVAAWGPAGTRALWSECRAGSEQFEPSGYHVGDADVVEAAGDGAELLWSGVGWRGSVVVRLRTFTTGALQRGTCPACGQPGLRVLPLMPLPRTNPSAVIPPAAGVDLPPAFAPPPAVSDLPKPEPDAAPSPID